MKKNLMNHAAGRMLFTFFLCCTMTTTVVNAQDAKSTILRVVSIPSEKHQQIIDAFHKFENSKK